MQAADARTLVTLLHVRDILSRFDATTPVVTEMLDDRNRVLAQVAQVDDVVVSGEIVSLLVTQLSEDHRLEAVFVELLGRRAAARSTCGPPSGTCSRAREVTFATVVAGAARRGETALGYRTPALAGDPDAASASGSTRPSPRRSPSRPGDRVVVLAEA